MTWWEGGDCHNCDAWESEETFNAFAQDRLGPGMARAGVQSEPQVTFHPAHEVYLPQAVTITSCGPACAAAVQGETCQRPPPPGAARAVRRGTAE